MPQTKPNQTSPTLAPHDVVDDFLSFLAPSSFPHQIATDSLETMEPDILWDHCLSAVPPPESSSLGDIMTYHASAFSLSPSHSFDLTKAPSSYPEAIARHDASVWRAAMDREKTNLEEMGAFEETNLPEGQRAIGLKWVYAHKKDPAGAIIHGNKKARLVAQGFHQRPGQYDKTYAPVAKMASVRILLAWAAVHDLEIFQFDCKTAFLHAKICHPVYGRQIPGYPLSNPKKVLRILVALYGLHQSAFEFYMLFLSLLLDLGMTRCEVDYGVFIGEWKSSPDPSVIMPLDGSSLVLYVPLHVDDGLAITNSHSLYAWFLVMLAKRLLIVDLGHCSKFLSILIIRDHPHRRLWMSLHVYISELLGEWNLSSCKPASTPFPSYIMDPPPAPLNSLRDISDAELLPRSLSTIGWMFALSGSFHSA